MKLVFLGRYRDLAGTDMAVPKGLGDLAALRGWLGQARPALAQAMADRCAVVVNQAVVRNPHHLLADNDEIAFLPPMSGG